MRKIGNIIFAIGLMLSGNLPNATPAMQGQSNQQLGIAPEGPPRPFQGPGEAEAAAVKALGGDPTAAWGLALHFTGSTYDSERFDYWIRIAAENGNHQALSYYGTQLTESDDRCSILRALYFIGLALKSTPASDTQCTTSLEAEIAKQRQRVLNIPGSNCLRSHVTPH